VLPAWKRAFDVTLVLLLLPIAAVLFAAIATWIGLISKGPVFFKQTRVGKGGKTFTMLKLRTMREGCPTKPHEEYIENLVRNERPMLKMDVCGDPRLVPGAYLIRLMALDELPQLINVLRGEMSLVGPRPRVACEFLLHKPSVGGRFRVEPGITGLWQVKRNSSTTFRQMLGYDEQYIESRSLRTGLTMLFHTPIALLREFFVTVHGKVQKRCHKLVVPDVFGEIAHPACATRELD